MWVKAVGLPAIAILDWMMGDISQQPATVRKFCDAIEQGITLDELNASRRKTTSVRALKMQVQPT
jgi:hypothetical protein